MGCGASAPMEEKTSPLDVDRTPSARLRVERSLSASVRGETAVTLRGYEFSGTLGYGAFARVLKARHIASGEDRAVKVIDKAVLRKKKTMRRSGSAIAVSSALDKLEAEITLQKDFAHGHIIRIFEVVEDPVADRTLLAVWKSKFYGALVLNHRVVLHAIDATPRRSIEPAPPRHRREMTSTQVATPSYHFSSSRHQTLMR